jgi:two-component system sensor histidine kinase/response regulator
MTANAMESDRNRCLQAGMNGFVTKPISEAALWQALLQWIEPRDATRRATRPLPIVAVSPWGQTQEGGVALLAALREIPDLDVGMGLTRTLHKPDLYISLLRRFVASQGGAVQRIRESLADANISHDADDDSPLLIAHTLKGLAGNLGALRLFASADGLEQRLGMASDPLALERALATTEGCLQSLVQALKQTPGFSQNQEVADTKALSAKDRQTGLQAIQEIKSFLVDNNANALEVWDVHADILRPLLTQWLHIESAINAFEFDRALDLLNLQET